MTHSVGRARSAGFDVITIMRNNNEKKKKTVFPSPFLRSETAVRHPAREAVNNRIRISDETNKTYYYYYIAHNIRLGFIIRDVCAVCIYEEPANCSPSYIYIYIYKTMDGKSTLGKVPRTLCAHNVLATPASRFTIGSLKLFQYLLARAAKFIGKNRSLFSARNP